MSMTMVKSQLRANSLIASISVKLVVQNCLQVTNQVVTIVSLLPSSPMLAKSLGRKWRGISNPHTVLMEKV